MAEYYAMPSFATFAVADPMSSVRWYREVLGFEVVFELPGARGKPRFVHLRRALHQDLLLVPAPPRFSTAPGEVGRGVTITFTVTEDIDALAAQAKKAGVRIVEGPIDRPWNVREVTLADPDGYRLTFAKMLRPRAFAELVQDVENEYDA
jgi:catechol 2,3-dioxygenase-like lactoylglutathione lyase family enzyme